MIKNKTTTKKIAVVTGGNSGIGLYTALSLHNAGCTVYELSRRNIEHSGITHIYADVTDESLVSLAIQQILEKEERIDILVNCAGFGISGAVEFTENIDAKKQIDVNFFGMVHVTKAVLPFMRKNNQGRIVNISSVAAIAPIPFQTYYSASKAAINAYSAALANEVKPYGISVTAILPGDIATGFTDTRNKSALGDDEYGGRISRSVTKMEQDEQNGMKPEKAGAYITKIALKKKVKPMYTIGFTYKCISLLVKFLPCRLVNWLIGFLYSR